MASPSASSSSSAPSSPAEAEAGDEPDGLSSFGAHIGQHLEEARALHQLGRAARQAGDIRGARELLEQALAGARAQNLSPVEQAAIMTDLGDALAESGERDRAITLQATAEALARRPGGEASRSLALFRLGREQLLADRPSEGLRALEQALPLLERAPNLELERDLRLTAARASVQDGQTTRAIRHLRAALPLLTGTEHRGTRAEVLSELGVLEAEGGELGAARKSFRDALSLYEALGDAHGEARTVDDLAMIAFREGSFVEAADTWANAAGLWERALSPRERTVSLAHVAWSYEKLGMYEPAQGALEQALACVRKHNLRGDEGAVNARFGRIYLAKGQGREARLAFESAASLRGLSFRTAGWIAPLGLARALALADDPGADDAYYVALDALDRAAVDTALDPIDAPWLEERPKAYQELIQRLLEQGRVEAALEVAERGRARTFQDLLESRAGDPRFQSTGTVSGITLAARGRGYEAVLDEVESVLGGLSPGARLQTPPRLPALDVAAIRAVAQGARLTVVSMYRLTDRVAVWIVDPEGRIDGKILPTPLERIEQLIGWTLAALNGSSTGRTPRGVTAARSGVAAGTRGGPPKGADLHSLLEDLYDALIDPYAPLFSANPADPVAFVTDGSLAAVPFGALIDAEGHLFMEHHPVVTTPATTFLIAGVDDEHASSMSRVESAGLYLVGEGAREGIPLPDERLESLREALQQGPFKSRGHRLRLVLDAGATEEAVLELLRAPERVQIVSRAFYAGAHPWLSGLVLRHAGESPPLDGVLTASELPWGGLNAKLLVLPPFDGPEGAVANLFGLELAWLRAGVKGLVVPLAGAGLGDDVAERFYAGLERGESRFEAMRSAQLGALRAGAELRQVAGLVLAGGW